MSAPWFPFFTADWIVGVTCLSAAERGVYVSLIAKIYDSEGPIKHDDRRLARECGMAPPAFKRALAALIETGKLTLKDGLIFNDRAKNELSERRNRRDEAAKAANARWLKHKENQHHEDATASPAQCAEDATRAHVLQSQKKDSSLEASASNAVPALSPFPAKPKYLDAKHELWGEGKAMLIDLGVSKSRCGALIGQWCKETRDDYAGVLDAIARAREFKPIDPVPWIVQALPRASKPKGNGHGKNGERTIFDVIDRAIERFDDLPDQRGDEMREGTVLSLPPTRV